MSLLSAIPDGALDKVICADDVGSEEDLYEDVHSSSHHYSHPGGGGEQLAINEVGSSLHGELMWGSSPSHEGGPKIFL